MTLFLAISLLFGGVTPETATGWMNPGRFGLSVGMARAAAVETLARQGQKTVPGKEAGHLLIHLDEKRTVTLAFEGDVLRSVRFELVDFIPAIKRAFVEAKGALALTQGAPSRAIASPQILQYEDCSPQIHVVAATDTTTEFGKKGVGFLVIRYFEPPPAR